MRSSLFYNLIYPSQIWSLVCAVGRFDLYSIQSILFFIYEFPLLSLYSRRSLERVK